MAPGDGPGSSSSPGTGKLRPGTAELLRQLQAPDRRPRERALLQLLGQPDPAALGSLLQHAASTSSGGDERALAFRALAACLEPGQLSVRPFLLQHRQDADPFVRAAVLVGLARLGGPDLVDLLRHGLGDESSLVRQTAHGLLAARLPRTVTGASGSREEGSRVPTAPDVPAAAADPARVRVLLERLAPGGPGGWEETSRQLAGLGPRALGLLLVELTGPEVKQRLAVAHALGLLGDRRAVEPIVARLRGEEGERDPQVLTLLLRSLALLLRPSDLAVLDCVREWALPARRARANDPFVRAAALDALARIPDSRTANTLIAALRDGDDWLRATAARALPLGIPVPSPELLPTLAAMLAEARSGEELVGLLLGLRQAYPPGGSFPPGLRRRVRELLGHPDSGVRDAALWLVDTLLSPTGTSAPPVDDEWLAMLVERVGDPQGAVQRHALELLADVAPLGYAPAAAPARELARSPDQTLARPALRVLGRVGDILSVEALLEAARPGMPNAREATRLLEQLSGPIRVERDPAGELVPVLALRCACGQRPAWEADGQRRELLVCPGCRASYLLTAAGVLTPVATLPHGYCLCCRRPAALACDADARLCCSSTGEVHLRHPATGTLYLLRDLAYGGCGCCQPPVPLFAREGRVYCPLSGRVHLPGPAGYAPVAPPSPAAPPAASPGVSPAVEEVNRALLEGSLLLTQSGLPLLDDRR
ncbi:MAG: HEAT repeat domain-containing protein [Myxococcota bacterium]|nr:HEAT repeat domain-containing protein [Myxococcota bacterium]